MDRKYLLKKSIRAAKLSRLIAKAIDLFIVLVLSLFYPVGLILAIVYLCVSDSLQNGQSVGKRFMGFSVISLEDGSPCSVKQSIVRNLPIIVPLAFAIIPFWGWVISLVIGIPLLVLEVYLLQKLDSGHRLGDVMADTTVMANDGERISLNKKTKTSWFDVTEKA
ncbi:RDD family protein [Halobacteriovorax sp. GB3]|uniref:RDD family protein n=1 Tax=Halobacteriovorax sp. GB3 TaxID=2719615 RepID=UPI0023614316|nr:RDD family protein [Halobacteriovorax sp. GB3]MDD0852434.1 RDD family protein [Halobacteriovorax sp. GB3]